MTRKPFFSIIGSGADSGASLHTDHGNPMAHLIQEFIFEAAQRTPAAVALSWQGVPLSYLALADMVAAAASGVQGHGLGRGQRLAVYLEKREEAVVAMFGAAAAGAVFVPVNPLLKPGQLAHILNDCAARILVTSAARLGQLGEQLAHCPNLETVIVVGAMDALPDLPGLHFVSWSACLDAAPALHGQPPGPTPGQRPGYRVIDSDMAAILYTSGSTGKPKGVVLSHRNMVAGALSVASYLGNTPQDRILALLPLSFDYGLSQLTTAFASGACVVLFEHLFARDVIQVVETESITGLAAVPPLWIQLAQLSWPRAPALRYITNSGGAMQRSTLDALRRSLPHTRVYLMYGLTEAFRSTFLEPEQLDLRPNSIGKAIPNAEVLVLREDGTECGPDEPGELVHRGPLVALGYWNDPEKTAQRFRPLPAIEPGLPLPETAVWSGDTVCADADGYLYFVGRRDEMIKTSGYRVSPAEVEEVVYQSGLVGEAAAVGVPHPLLGQAIALLATPRNGQTLEAATLVAACKAGLPAFMLPAWIEVRDQSLPRNPNGKIDRKLLAEQLSDIFSGATR